MSREQTNRTIADEHNETSFILRELERCPENSYAGLFCSKCQHIEKHKKLKKEWVCQWCGNSWEVTSL
ncbi:hypothetical protein NSQ62_07935 [Solibacillus sp. FSL H8-0523]|uniref:hypothetical protein n=1 Tax=Solibacillus sp. FSL H8-0523 TaxID=2954511 RepID=UPI0031014AB6